MGWEWNGSHAPCAAALAAAALVCIVASPLVSRTFSGGAGFSVWAGSAFPLVHFT